MVYVNFGDMSAQHGQFWIARGGDDYAECVEIIAGSDIGLAENQYRIEKGSIYFSPDNWDAALSVVGFDKIGPPEYLEIAYAFNAYMGFERDTWGGLKLFKLVRFRTIGPHRGQLVMTLT